MERPGLRWGVSPEECLRPYPCDDFLPNPVEAYYRGVDVEAPPAVLFRWLCQLRIAPYSYDWIDNLGRRSPGRLIPGLENLEVGQRAMTIFEILSFETERHITFRIARASEIFGEVLMSYVVEPRGQDRSRLLVKLSLASYPGGLFGRLVRQILPFGDWVMMRRQMLNLKRLSERQPWIRDSEDF